MADDTLKSTVVDVLDTVARVAEEASLRPHFQEFGVVTFLGPGVARVEGLPNLKSEELVVFENGLLGLAFNLDAEDAGIILLDSAETLESGSEVRRTGRVLDTVVGAALLGRVLDPLGRPLDNGEPLHAVLRAPIEAEAPPIMDRSPVSVPLATGTKAVDALIPVGRGQRQLILGDRQTGKSAIAIDCILNQKGKDVICIYCAIGQRNSSVAKMIADLRDRGAMEYSIVVVASGDAPAGLQFAAPYAAMTMGEYFMHQGRDVLLVLDDLTSHADAYRELSLLLRRPPGRESFPGDIFYIHSRMLERATRLSKERGGGSLTALPIIETEAQDISAYIPTNLISITDGQIYLSPSLFELGVLPAVDVGKSVSRVGGKAQSAVYRAVAGDLKLAYAQFEELETFARFGARLDENTRTIIDHGRRIRACLQQSELAPVAVPAQITVLLALAAKLFDVVPLDRMKEAEHAVHEAAANLPADIRARFVTSKDLSDEDRKAIIETARRVLEPFQPKVDVATNLNSATEPGPKAAPRDK